MSGPVARIDPDFAAALDRYTVPPASADFADRVVAAARHGSDDAPTARRFARDRRGPWRRRAIAGGLALLLGTTAAAAALLDRVVGIRLPDAVAMLSPLPIVSTPQPVRRAPPKHAPARPSTPRVASAPTVAPVPAPLAAPSPVAETPPRPFAAVRARLAAMPPAERRVVVRRVIARRIAARAAERRAVLNGEMPPPAAGVVDRAWRRTHPAARAALIERVAQVRANRVARLEVPPPPLDLSAPLPPVPATAPAVAVPETPGEIAPAAMRLERLRAMRELRALRRGWRRLPRR